MGRRSEKCDSLCRQARLAREQGWPDQADLLLNEAIRQRPSDIETRRQLAETMWESGRRTEALAEYEDLVLLQPHDPKLRKRQAVLQWSHGEREAAAQTAEMALQLDPHSIDALLVKARAEAARRDFESAVASYIRLTQLAPDQLDAKFELAEIHVRRGNPDQACPLLRDVMQHAQSTTPQRAEAEWKLGLAYASAERWTDAVKHLTQSIEQREASDRDWQCLAAAKALAGQDSEAAKAMARLASSHPLTEPNTVWSELQDRLVKSGQPRTGRDDSLAAGALSEGVIRADFSQSAMAKNPKSEVRGQRSEVRSQRSGAALSDL